VELREQLRKDLNDADFRHAYSDENLNLWIAAQIKVLREQQNLSQKELAERIGSKQAGVSRLESANYSGWSVRILKKLAEAFDLRLRISFEEFGSLWQEVNNFSKENLQRRSFRDDPEFHQTTSPAMRDNAPHNAMTALVSGSAIRQLGAAEQDVVSIDQSREWGGHKKPPGSALDNWAPNGTSVVGGSACSL